jgi:hypothetical protein
MKNEVATKTQNELSTELLNDWGAPQISASDVIIPKILPMQGLSVAVAEGRASMGEFRDSLSNNLLGDIKDKPVHCIPFFVDKAWDIMHEQADGSFKWAKTVPVVENPASPDYNDNWKWEDEVDGIKVKNVRRFNFFVLLPDEIEKGSSIPYTISFKSTSIKEGKKLLTQMYMRNIRAGVPPAAFTIKLGGTRQKNDKGIFIVPNFTVDRKSTDVELQECLHWIKMIKSGRTKVDDSDVQGSAAEVDVQADGAGEF